MNSKERIKLIEHQTIRVCEIATIHVAQMESLTSEGKGYRKPMIGNELNISESREALHRKIVDLRQELLKLDKELYNYV